MTENILNVRMKTKIDTEENWITNNPILKDGELGYIQDKYGSGRYKIGDGITPWNDLEFSKNYFIGTRQEYIDKNEAGLIRPGTIICITDDNDYYNIPVDDYMSEENEHVVYNKTITKALRLNNASENCISADITPEASVNSDYSYTLPAAGSVNGSISNLGDWLSSHRSGFYTMYIANTWYNVISNRHRNGLSDGTKYGMVFYTHLTSSNDNLLWDSQAGGVWRGQRTILDNVNYSDIINKIRDIGNGNQTTFAYSKSGLGQGSYSWLAGWNGYELRAVSRDHFLGAKYANGYWGMTQPSGADNVWIRTTNQGIIPYQSGGRGGGHQQLGTDSWYFSKSYIDTMYGVNLNLSGTLNTSVSTGTYINSAKGVNVAVNMTANPGYNMLGRVRSSGGAFMIGCYNNCFRLLFMNNTKINNNTNSPTRDIVLLDENGGSSFAYSNHTHNYASSSHSHNRVDSTTYIGSGSDNYITQLSGRVTQVRGNGGLELFVNDSSPWIQIKNIYNNQQRGFAIKWGGTEVSPTMDNYLNLGGNGARWKQLWAATSSIATSDRREKKEISYIGFKSNYDTEWSDKTLIEFINGLKPVVYKRIDGDSDRPHHGLIAQDVEELMNHLGIYDHAAFIRTPDEEVKEIKDDNGIVIDRERIIKKNEYSYGLRYEEFISDIIKYIQILYKKNEELEKQLTDKDVKIIQLYQKLNILEDNISIINSKISSLT